MKLKIISDGVSLPKLVDEDSGEMIHLIQRLIWKAKSGEFLTKTNIEIVNIPVEIVAKATIHIQRFIVSTGEFETVDQIEKRIKIVSSTVLPETPGRIQDISICDAETNEALPGVLEVVFDVDATNEVRATIKQWISDIKNKPPTPSSVEERVASIEPIDVREFGDVFTDIYAAGKGTAP